MQNLQKQTGYTSVSTDEDLYDLSMLEEMDDNEYLVEVLIVFLQEAPVQLKEMREALHNRSVNIVSQKAHSLKGSAGVIQAKSLMGYLHKIEILGRAGIFNDELISLVENVRQHYNQIEQALKRDIKELK